MKKIRAVIVDDEAPAREEMMFLLKKHDDIDVVGSVSGGEEALQKILEYKPDLLFLDIQMPELSGFDLISLIKELKPKPIVVLVTAYDKYALKAFEFEALDYLLKPVNEKRIEKTLQRVREILNRYKISDKLDSLINKLDSEGPDFTKIPAEKNGRIYLINPSDIYYAYSEEGKTFIKTRNNSLLTSFTLRDLEKRFDSTAFFRAHKSYLVNLNKVKEIQPWSYSTYKLVLKDGSEINVSRNHAKELRGILGI
ncbi:MAG: hypothetical protein PWQ82_1608 [Thermosediminibacterales bacterium]|nr:hypothetical protein [Thermosediminibacterales bacterium]MDK2836285.1 hypothetical protein [Thermosediminibacterales bacterium]